MVELYGPDNDGWYDTRVKDWVALCEDLKDGEVRGYLVLRSLVVEKYRNHVRKLTLQLLCELIPSPSGGPSSLTRVRGILDGLTRVGLVTTPEGKPIKTSSRASALGKPLRIQINDSAPEDYMGWRNSEDKLKALGTALAELVEKESEASAAGPVQDTHEAGRISDPQAEAGRISDPLGRISDPLGRISDPHTADDQHERDLPPGFSSGSSLSHTARISGDRQTADGEREASTTEASGAEVPGQRTEPEQPPAVSPGDWLAELWAAERAVHGASTSPVRRKAFAREVMQLLAQGHTLERLEAGARVMGAHARWFSLATQIDATPEAAPVPPGSGATGAGVDARTAAADCGLCDAYGWLLDDDDDRPQRRCTHPDVTAMAGAAR
ncbi:hypothetical protein ACFU3J_16310 [Streptomyces sp. NPDC057411]|uniref:hypothetical protein n=1 Tax=unclassified Streptomyces TaxID=2593676 RepID=UPI003640FC23